MPPKSKYSDEEYTRQTVIIRKEYLKELKKLAIDEDKDNTEILEEAVRAYLKKKKKI